MASAVKSNYYSCFDETSCFRNPKHWFVQKCGTAALADKMLKTVDPILDFAGVIAEARGASEETLKDIAAGRRFFKTGRDVVACFNIFQGIIPALLYNLKHIAGLSANLWSGETAPHYFKKFTPTTPEARPAVHNEYAETREEKVAALCEQTGKAISAATYTVGFGLCRPIANYQKYINKNINASAASIGKAFPTVMMVNHVGGIMGGIGGLAFQGLAYRRATDKFRPLTPPSPTKTPAVKPPAERSSELVSIDNAYHKKVLESSVALAKSVLEFGSDIIIHTEYAAPAWLRIPLHLSIGCLDITKELLKDH